MRIAGIGSATPKKVVTNEMLSEFLETSDEWDYFQDRYQRTARIIR